MSRRVTSRERLAVAPTRGTVRWAVWRVSVTAGSRIGVGVVRSVGIDARSAAPPRHRCRLPISRAQLPTLRPRTARVTRPPEMGIRHRWPPGPRSLASWPHRIPQEGTMIETVTGIVVVGAGQAGLAMSRCLTDRGLPHVVLERAGIADSWHSRRWDSFRLLSPNWQTRLPGWRYGGADPGGFMTGARVA